MDTLAREVMEDVGVDRDTGLVDQHGVKIISYYVPNPIGFTAVITEE